MHCVLTADLAGLLSQHGPAILHCRKSISSEAIAQYWASSRNRFELWHRTISRYKDAEKSGDLLDLRRWWQDHSVVLEEVFVTEILTRVIAALAAGLESSEEEDEISPVTHTIFLTHLEARNRVQQMMLFGRGNSVQDAVRLNRLRQAAERWSDALVGRMANESSEILRYAVDPDRAHSFAEETRSFGPRALRETACWLMNTSMHDTLRRRTTPRAALPDANRGVVRSVMLMLRPDLFDSVGVLKSLWLHRLQHGADQTDRVIEELNGPDLDYAITATGVEATHEAQFQRWYL